MEKIFITAADGYRLGALYSVPFNDSIGTIVISSATGVRKEFYLNFSHYLVRSGYTVLLFDYRGIGDSAPADLRKMDSYMHEWGTKDMNAVMNFLVHEKKLTDITWIGHSVGAQMVGFIKEQQHIRKVVSINAAFGYWGYLPSPWKWLILGLWYFVAPLMMKFYGYGKMRKIGWGENLPPNIFMQWRKWCLNRKYFTEQLEETLGDDKFYGFSRPIVAIYMSDDYIANEKSAPLMMQFFPNAPQRLLKLQVDTYTHEKVGHTGIFRQKFATTLWPLLLSAIETAHSFPVRGKMKAVKANGPGASWLTLY